MSERYRQQRPVKRSWQATFHQCGQPCGNDVHRSPSVCGHIRRAPEPRRGLCGNLLDQWSALLCLAMYGEISR